MGYYGMYPPVIKHGWLENPRAEFRFLARKITELNGPFSSKPWLITRGYPFTIMSPIDIVENIQCLMNEEYLIGFCMGFWKLTGIVSIWWLYKMKHIIYICSIIYGYDTIYIYIESCLVQPVRYLGEDTARGRISVGPPVAMNPRRRFQATLWT